LADPSPTEQCNVDHSGWWQPIKMPLLCRRISNQRTDPKRNPIIHRTGINLGTLMSKTGPRGWPAQNFEESKPKRSRFWKVIRPWTMENNIREHKNKRRNR
jgi:hypothetical protein